MITVNITNEKDSIIHLDRYFVTLDSDTVLTEQNSYYNPSEKFIVIFSDSEMNWTTEKGRYFRLTGYIDDDLLVDENYLIAHDRCHINLISGNTNIVIP
jgi:arginine deiminase